MGAELTTKCSIGTAEDLVPEPTQPLALPNSETLSPNRNKKAKVDTTASPTTFSTGSAKTEAQVSVHDNSLQEKQLAVAEVLALMGAAPSRAEDATDSIEPSKSYHFTPGLTEEAIPVAQEIRKFEVFLQKNPDSPKSRDVMCCLACLLIVCRNLPVKGLELLRDATQGVTWEENPNMLSWARVLQGIAWLQLGDPKEAVEFLLVALHAYDVDFCRMQWAKIHKLLGDAYTKRAKLENREKHLMSAIYHYTAGTKTLNPVDYGQAWKMCLASLVETYQELWLWDGKRTLYEKIVAVLNEQESRVSGDAESTLLVHKLKGTIGSDKSHEDHMKDVSSLEKQLAAPNTTEEDKRALRSRLAVFYIKVLWENEKGLSYLNDILASLGDSSDRSLEKLRNWVHVWTGVAYMQMGNLESAVKELQLANLYYNQIAATGGSKEDLERVQRKLNDAKQRLRLRARLEKVSQGQSDSSSSNGPKAGGLSSSSSGRAPEKKATDGDIVMADAERRLGNAQMEKVYDAAGSLPSVSAEEEKSYRLHGDDGRKRKSSKQSSNSCVCGGAPGIRHMYVERHLLYLRGIIEKEKMKNEHWPSVYCSCLALNSRRTSDRLTYCLYGGPSASTTGAYLGCKGKFREEGLSDADKIAIDAKCFLECKQVCRECGLVWRNDDRKKEDYIRLQKVKCSARPSPHPVGSCWYCVYKSYSGGRLRESDTPLPP